MGHAHRDRAKENGCRQQGHEKAECSRLAEPCTAIQASAGNEASNCAEAADRGCADQSYGEQSQKKQAYRSPGDAQQDVQDIDRRLNALQVFLKRAKAPR